MFTLETFGGLSLRGADGPITSRAGQRRRLALLAILAAERRPVSRDKLVGYFWPDANAERARHLLADSLYVLRAGSREDAITTFGDDVSLNQECVRSDVAVFLDAIDAGDLERAVSAYSGPFLDGIFISDAPEFERWAESTRTRLEGERRQCLERLATDAGARRDHANAVRRWRDLATADRLSSRAAVGLIRALSAAGDRAAALQFARVHEEIVRSELDSAPDPAVAALVAELRLRDEVRPRLPVAHPTPSPDPPRRSSAEPTVPERLTTGPHLTRRAAAIGAVAIVTVAAAAVLVRSLDSGPAAASAVSGPLAVDSGVRIAVLPFEAISSDREADFIAAGITDQLTTLLGRVPAMRVVSRTSAVAASRLGVGMTAIGETLHAQYLIEGSVRLSGTRLRVDPRLVVAASGVARWSQDYESDFSPSSIIGIEEAIAESIAVKLNIGVAAGAVSRLATRAPATVEALEAYYRGSLLLKSRNPDGARKAITYFNEVLTKDSLYAPAYAALADAYAVFGIGNIGDFDPRDYFPRARDAAMHALALDSTLAEAHAALGYYELLYNLRWDAAAAEIQRAVELQPSYTSAHIYRTVLFEWTGQFADAIAEARVARESDLLSPVTNIELGRALFFAGRDRDAENQLRRTLDLDSTSLRTHLHLGQVLERQHRFWEAIAELGTAARLSTNSSRPLALLAHAEALAGNRAEASRLLDSLFARKQRGYVPAFDFAIVYAGLGDASNTMQWLEASLTDRSIRPYLLDPTFYPVRDDARFDALLKRLNVPARLPTR